MVKSIHILSEFLHTLKNIGLDNALTTIISVPMEDILTSIVKLSLSHQWGNCNSFFPYLYLSALSNWIEWNLKIIMEYHMKILGSKYEN